MSFFSGLNAFIFNYFQPAMAGGASCAAASEPLFIITLSVNGGRGLTCLTRIPKFPWGASPPGLGTIHLAVEHCAGKYPLVSNGLRHDAPPLEIRIKLWIKEWVDFKGKKLEKWFFAVFGGIAGELGWECWFWQSLWDSTKGLYLIQKGYNSHYTDDSEEQKNP